MRNPYLYIAGPMRGLPRFNFDAFDDAESELKAWGFYTISPAQHDRECGFDPDGKADYNVIDLAEVITWDLRSVAFADGVYMLRGWEKSSGARLEHDLARFLGKPVLFEGDLP